MPCPHLKEVVMLYCDAFPIKKMVPLDKLVSADPCLTRNFERCPLCGGRTGYSAYYLKHGQPERQGQEVAADAEEDALLAALLASVGQEVAGSVEDRESSPTAAEPVPSDVFAASGWAGVSV